MHRCTLLSFKLYVRLSTLVLVLTAVVATGLARPAHAQFAIYAQGSGANLHLANTKNLYGSTFGFYRTYPTGPLALGFDYRGALLFGGNDQGAYTDDRLDYGLLGLRAALSRKVSRVQPYVEGLVGIGYFRGGLGTVRQDHTSGNLQAVAGVDYRILKGIDWRVAEFSYGRLKGQLVPVHPGMVSTGIVFHLP